MLGPFTGIAADLSRLALICSGEWQTRLMSTLYGKLLVSVYASDTESKIRHSHAGRLVLAREADFHSRNC